MPSSPDHIRSQRLADVYARAERLRRQRRARLGTGAALLGSLAVFVVALLAGSTLEVPQEVSSADRPGASSTTTSQRPFTSTTTGDVPTEAEPEEGSTTAPDEELVVDPPPTSPPTHLPATSTTVASEADPGPQDATDVPTCRNSRDPACGPFYFDPPPVNEPMAVDVTYSPENPEPGEEVTFTVRVRDDGPASPGSCTNLQTYGEDGAIVGPVCSASCAPSEPKYGPWDPPPPENANFEETFRHTYTEPGTYTATFFYRGTDCSFSPYRSSGEASVRVAVG